MGREEELYRKFSDDVQDYFASVEVIDASVPADALFRIQDFFERVALASVDSDQRDELLDEADHALDKAIFHCQRLLTMAYINTDDQYADEFNDYAQRHAGNAKFYPRLLMLEDASNEAYDIAEDERKHAIKKICEEYGFDDEDDREAVNEIESLLGDDEIVVHTQANAYEAAKALYEHWYKGLMRVQFIEDRRNPSKPFQKVETALDGMDDVTSILDLIFG